MDPPNCFRQREPHFVQIVHGLPIRLNPFFIHRSIVPTVSALMNHCIYYLTIFCSFPLSYIIVCLLNIRSQVLILLFVHVFFKYIFLGLKIPSPVCHRSYTSVTKWLTSGQMFAASILHNYREPVRCR